jgi:REP-associated tyrosine transposase
LYFITICTQNREHLFGKIENSEMKLNNAGINADQCWLNIPKDFSNVKLHTHITMPNQIHGIIEIIVGAKSFSPNNANNMEDRRFLTILAMVKLIEYTTKELRN